MCTNIVLHFVSQQLPVPVIKCKVTVHGSIICQPIEGPVSTGYLYLVFRIRIDLMRIRIQVFKVNADTDPALEMNVDLDPGNTFKNN
jgi:hypothetical protein